MGLSLLTVLGLATIPLVAQEPAPGTPPPAATTSLGPSRRVPPYFGELGLPAHIKRDKMEKTRVQWKKVTEEVKELMSLPFDTKLTEGQDWHVTKQ